MRIGVILLVASLLQCFGSKAQSLYNKENSSAFATYLYASGNYNLASAEFERLLFLEPENDSLRQMIMKSLLLNGDFEAGADRALAFNVSPQNLSNGMASLYSYSLISAGKPLAARSFVDISTALGPEQKLYYKAYSYLLDNEFKEARKLKSESSLLMQPELAQLIDETANMPHRSPALAAGLSAMIPGLGKFYTGDWKDAIIALVTVGVTGYQSYRGFNRNGINSGYGWIYGSLAAGFYLGNIYGSASSAKRFNKRQTDKIAQRIRHSFMLRP